MVGRPPLYLKQLLITVVTAVDLDVATATTTSLSLMRMMIDTYCSYHQLTTDKVVVYLKDGGVWAG